MAVSNNNLSRKTLYALADVDPGDVGDDHTFADNLENVLTDFETIGDLLCSFDSEVTSSETVRRIGWQIQKRATATKALADEWRHAKHKQRLEAVPGSIS